MADLVVDEALTGTRDDITQLQRWWRPTDATSLRSGSSSAVLVVHGIAEHSGRYDHLGRFLAARGHDVLAFDSRGHGQSGGRRGHIDRFEVLLDDLEDLVVERRQLGHPVVLVGHSLGGLISTSYVVSGRPPPDLLVLSAPALGAGIARWQRLAAPVLGRVTPRLFVRAEVDAELLSHDTRIQRAYRNDPLRVAGSTARFGCEIFNAMVQTSAALDRITMPTYVFHGSADRLVPPSYSQPLASYPNVTYRLWPGLRHECLNEESRGQVLGELARWLAGALASLEGRAADQLEGRASSST